MDDESNEQRSGGESGQHIGKPDESGSFPDIDTPDASLHGREAFHGGGVIGETSAADREDHELQLEHRRQMEARRLEHELEMEAETLRTQRDLRRHELELNHQQRRLERQLDLKEQERLLGRRFQTELAARQRELAANYMSTVKATIIEQQFARVSEKARRREVISFILLGLLLAAAAGSVYAGRLVDDPIFWAVSATIFFMSCVGIIVFTAAGLGASAQMVELIRMQFRSEDLNNQVSLMQIGSDDAVGDIVTLRALFDGEPTAPSGKGDGAGDNTQPASIESIRKHTTLKENSDKDHQ